MGIGAFGATQAHSASASASVNIYGGTVTAQTDNGAQPIGTNPELMPYGKVTVTIAKGLKCVKTDDQNTAYAYDNTDGTSITITKCTEHKWSYTNITNDTHDRTCDLCGTAETGVAHTTARYQYIRADIHRLICACGKGYSTEYHTYTYAPNSDGLTHTATCKCEYSVDDIAHTYKGEDEICICGAVHSATYDGKKYASLQSAIDAAAPVGGTVTLARQVNENVVSTDGTVTIDLGGNRWRGYIDDWGSIVPLTVNGGSVTLKNGNLFQWWSSSSARTGIEINDGSVTIEEDVRVRGGIPEGDVLSPSITLNGGTLILKEGAVLLTGLQVPEGKVLADYLPEGTAFVKCSYDNSSDTVTVSDPQEFVSDVYSTNRSTEGMMIVSHTHDFGGGTACPCGFNCDHSVVDSATGKCENCGTQIYVASLVKADGTVTNYEAFADAWDAAVDNEGSTLKLLCDITLDKAEDGIIAQSGKFTLDLNGNTVSGEITNQLLTVSGAADITVRNGKLINTFNKDQTDINKSCANALAIDGGTVTLDVVELTAGHGFKSARSCAAYIFSGSLTVVNGTFTGLFGVADVWGAHPSVKITSATLHDGIYYDRTGITAIDYAGLKAFFADGSMLFDKDGKYIDVEDEAYWRIDGEGENTYVSFGYSEECVIKPHTHDTYVDGKCAECDYACPHDSGINDREAGYFEKAICSVCHAEYGNYAKDTNKPTGRIEIKERTWWESFIHAITFGLFYKEKVTVEITASDDSYSQAGYDETKHAVKIEYLISNTELSLETVKNSAFTEYKGEIDISDDSRYVVYARLNDFAGNEEYISTDGFVIDTTPPAIEVDADGQSKRYSNGQRAEVCGDTQINFIDDNFDTAYRTIDGEKDKIWSSPFLVAASDTDRTERWITFEVHDKAGNISTVEVYVHKEHSFDEETGVCAYCGYQAAVLIKCSNDNNEEEFVSGGGLDETMRKADENRFDRFYLKLYGNVEKMSGAGTYGSTSKKWTFDLNGYTISNPSSVDPDSVAALFYVAGDITFVGNGAMNADVMVDGGQLTIDGECSFQKLEHKRGTLTVNAGSFESLIISKLDVGWSYTRETALYGGHYGEVKIVDIEGLTCADLLARGYRFEGLTLEQAKVTELKDATIVACDHADIGSDGICPDCGMEFFLSVEANGTTKLFETFESAIRYAEQNDGCTVKLLKDITVAGTSSMVSHYRLAFTEGSYTLDLAGKTLTVGAVEGSYLTVSVECDLAISDSVGGGKIVGETGAEAIEVRGKLTVSGGDFTEIYKIEAYGADSLVLEGGSFKMVSSAQSAEAVSPLSYLAEERAYQLTTGDNRYANESDVVRDTVGTMTTCYIRNVSVVSAPLKFHGQPRDDIYYLTMPNYEKWAIFTFLYSGGYPSKGDIAITGERIDGTVVHTNTVKPTRIFQDGINLWDFTTEDSGQYRIKLEYNGYVLYSNTFTITMAVCEHPGYDEYNKCSQCYCDLAAAIVKDGKTTGYVNFADALTAAQTDENKGCTLKLLADVSGNVTVKSGKFTLDATSTVIDGKLNVAKGADLTVSGGVITGNVICAKGGKLTAVNSATFTGAINCVGEGDFRNCQLAGTVAGKYSLKLYSCEIIGDLSISGNAEAEECIVNGTVIVNNGGSLKSTGGTYKNTVNVKSGGTLEIVSGTFDKKLTAESGSKLIVSGGSYAEVGAENNVDFTLNGGEFTNITVNGQHLIDCLAEGKALKDMNIDEVIDGRVGIAGNVQVVDHTHTCVWKTSTHEKLCGCGYVEATDTEAPVISGIDPENNHYGSLEFTVTDANDFTVWMDDEEITLVNGKYTMEPDNEIHLITATDVAGNTVSFRFGLFKTYHVTLPTGAGYTLFSSDGLTVRHGNSFSFIVQFNNGYSKTEDFKVLVNGNKLDEWDSDANSASFAIRNVSENLVITVEGVADITAPEVEVSIRGNSFKEFLNRITFGLFFKQTQSVEVKANDFGSGIYNVEYLLSETAFTDKDAITGDWTELTLNADRKAYFSIAPNQKTFVYVRVTDKSGNITVVNTDGVVLYTDAEAITGTMVIKRLDEADASFAVKLNGNTVKALYNGDTMIAYGSDYTVSEDGIITLKAGYLSTLAAGEYTIRVQYNPMGESFGVGDEPAMTTVKLTVEKVIPTVDLEPRTQKTYDGYPIDSSVIKSYIFTDGARTWEYKPVGADDSEYTTTAPKNAGEYTVRLTTAETDNCYAGEATALFVITQKEVTIKDVTVSDKIYDGTADAEITSDGTAYGLVGSDNVTIVTGKATFSDKNVGTDKTVTFTGFSLTGDDAANYMLVKQPDAVTADITVKEITINGAAVEASKVYDGTTDAKISNAGTLSDNYDGDDLTIVAGRAAYNNKNVGIGKTVNFTDFSISGAAAGNYKLIVQPSSVIADITAKAVSIINTAVSPSRVYNGGVAADITDIGTISGAVDGDDLSIISGTAYYDNKNVGTGKMVTFSAFALSGTDADNYNLVSQPASVTAAITAREVTIGGVTVEGSKTYDGTTDAKITNAGTLSENFDGDNLVIVIGKASYDNKNVGAGKTVSFTDFALSGSEAGNYKLIAQPTDVTADITVKEITIIGAAVEPSRIYDGTTDAKITNAGMPSDNYDGENLVVAIGSASYDNKNVGTGKTVNFTDFALSGSEAGNYKLVAQPTDITADITVKEIKIIGAEVEASKIYDGNTDAKITASGTFDGLIDGDDVTIVTGKAAYDDKNVGTDKTITFTGFDLAGDDAANYLLSSQPVSTTASITPKELTITDLKVKDKQYDGKNTAEIDGTPTLVGVVDGDELELVNGVPTFDSVTIGKDIPLSFTAFTLSGDSVTVGNYTLTQPSGITANIVEYAADGSEYDVNSNDWINTDFVIKAKNGYKLSLTDTANGEWTDSLTASDETDNGKLTFYVKNTETGVISAAVTESYKIDKTTPTGEVKLNERTAFQEFISKITFGLFFKDDVNVKLTAKDDASGVKSVLYFKSDRILTDDDIRAVTDWTDNSDFDIKAEDMAQFIVYVRIEDNAGNVAYIGSDGATFDTTAPEIVGVENGKTYYVTKKIAIDDENFESVTLNGESVEDVFILAGDTDATYVIRATDKAGNVTEYTVYMKPISSITDIISGIRVDNVKSSDMETISEVERQILDIAEMFDDGESTDDEWNKLTEAAAKCKSLSERIAEVAEEIARLTDTVNGYDIDKVTSDDKADIEKLIADIDILLEGDNLTEEEREELISMRDKLNALLDKIAAVKDAIGGSVITGVEDITKDNVKADERKALEDAKKEIEKALEDYENNYTEDELDEIRGRLEEINKALDTIDNAEKIRDAIKKLPDESNVKLSDKEEIIKVSDEISKLTENEKKLVGDDMLGKAESLVKKIAELESVSFNPSIIEGAGQTWNVGSDAGAIFRSNAEFDEFIRILVDRNEIDSSCYTVSDGSTVVTLKPEYLGTLSVGEHTLSIVSRNGSADTVFTVYKKDDSPKTGDIITSSIWFALITLSGGIAIGTRLSSKKKRESEE